MTVPEDVIRQADERTFASILPGDGLGVDAIATTGVPWSTADNLVTPCGTESLRITSWHSLGGASRTWTLTDDTLIEQYSEAYYGETGAEVIHLIRATVTCSSEPRTGVNVSVKAIPPGIGGDDNAYIVCEIAEKARCSGLLARDNVVTRILVRAISLSRAENILRSILPRAHALLLRAW
ncbi:MAG TPA: hypothetical protein VFE14_02265 [Micromonosporaceae bacterium]|jgi:hypothetical protein|nr:hypothetical protein [Micromonosporaceae bacterium]